MERIEPNYFKGPRAYFTNFDHRIIRRTKNREKLRQDIERKLKILLLTKKFVVCAASHLTSEFVYQLFKENPMLLNKELIIPALRRDKSDISELFEREKRSTLKQEMIGFYRNVIPKTVNWELEENSTWFRNSFLRELKNENSVLRKNLVKLTNGQVKSMIEEIEKDPILDRAKIDFIAAKLNQNERRILINFRELIYHISGARVVNCEGVLPQENYIDYSLADINKRQIILSEFQIFWKIFLELAFETIQMKEVPLEFLDVLSFEDICELRHPIEDSSFRNNYDELIKKSVASVNKKNPNNILYDIEELLSIKEKISKEFEIIFQRELRSYLKRKAIKSAKVLWKNTISIGLGFAGFFPILTPISSIGSIVLDSPAFFVNLNQTFLNLRALDNYQIYLKAKEKMLKKIIQRSEISEKSCLFDVVNMITEIISKRSSFLL
jgi:hypothetical protein